MPEAASAGRIARRKNEFRDKITRAALMLFDRDGIADTSIAAIIKEADIAHKTFFNHFPSKDHLLQHIVNTHSASAYEMFRKYFARHSDPAEQLAYCLQQAAEVLQKLDANRYRELLTFYFMSSASTREFRETQKQAFRELITQILQAAAAQGRLNTQFTVDTLADMVTGLCVSTLLNWCVEENYPVAEKMRETVQFINATVFEHSDVFRGEQA